MKVEQADGTVTVERPTNRGEHRALHGLTRSLIANMVEGVTDGFEKRLEIQGVGYRAQLKGKSLEMAPRLLQALCLERGAVADALDLEALLEAVGHALDHVRDQALVSPCRARCSPRSVGRSTVTVRPARP